MKKHIGDSPLLAPPKKGKKSKEEKHNANIEKFINDKIKFCEKS
jgi:hypothetical protein